MNVMKDLLDIFTITLVQLCPYIHPLAHRSRQIHRPHPTSSSAAPSLHDSQPSHTHTHTHSHTHSTSTSTSTSSTQQTQTQPQSQSQQTHPYHNQNVKLRVNG